MTDAISSLLPYLKEETGQFHFRIMPAAGDGSELVRTAYPFLTLSDSNPFGRLLAAQLLSDTASNVGNVFFLTQKDRYSAPKDSLRPINNGDVDRIWQDTFAFFSHQQRNSTLIVLKNQLNDDGHLIPFEPVFYCRFVQKYFHPPCAVCGNPLHQCKDDSILDKAGLNRYSTSLDRYLFCTSCLVDTGDSQFNVYKYGSADPLNVKDFSGMIRDYGRLIQERSDLETFPCARCTFNRECYSLDNLVVDRLVPFSFYSFYMLIFEAMSINASDFLALAGGSSFAALEQQLVKKKEPGRLGCLRAINRHDAAGLPFIFEGDDRNFLEVFYLKLSLLIELAAIVLSESAEFGPDTIGPLLDAVWIRLDADGRRLPYTWNFKVELIDLVRRPAEDSAQPPALPMRNRHFLGLVWFFTLLVNGRQDISVVYPVIKGVIKRADRVRDWLLREPGVDQLDQVLTPVNLFWNPADRLVREDWWPLWKRALGMGFSLLVNLPYPDQGWSRDEWLEGLETLRAEVKDRMFAAEAASEASVQSAETEAAGRSEVEAISRILERIREKWANAAAAAPAVAVPVAEPEMGAAVPEMGLPLAVSAFPGVAESPLPEKIGPVPPAAPAKVAFVEDVITETIIISPEKPPGDLAALVAGRAKPANGLKVETSLAGFGVVGIPAEASDVMAETVFLGASPQQPAGPGKDDRVSASEPEPEALSPAEMSAEDFLPDTIILTPGQGRPGRMEAPGLQRSVQSNGQTTPQNDQATPRADVESGSEGELLETVLIVPSRPKVKDAKGSHD